MRLGAFHKQLVDWNERPCALSMYALWGSGPIIVTGILRPHYSVTSLRGWALVPPREFGGTACFTITPLGLEGMLVRRLLLIGGVARLRFWVDPDVPFELQVLGDTLTAEPREIRPGRYLYAGGRRRPEPWAS